MHTKIQVDTKHKPINHTHKQTIHTQTHTHAHTHTHTHTHTALAQTHTHRKLFHKLEQNFMTSQNLYTFQQTPTKQTHSNTNKQATNTQTHLKFKMRKSR